MKKSRFSVGRLAFAAIPMVFPLLLAACGQTDSDTATGVGDMVPAAGQSQIISQEVNSEIAAAASSAATSLQTLQQAQAPISTPVVSNVLTPSTTRLSPGMAVPAPVSEEAIANTPSADPNVNDAYVPPAGSTASMAMAAPVSAPLAAPAAVHAAPMVDLSGLPPELAQPLTIRWSGTVTGALQEISQRIGYRFVQTGVMQGSHPEISLDENNSPAADVLQDVGLQVQRYGHVDVNPAAKTISLNLN
jgi:hypothetical protein